MVKEEGSGRLEDTLKYCVKQNRPYSLATLFVRGCSIAGSVVFAQITS